MVRINDNIIYPSDMRDIAGRVLNILDDQNINSLKDLRYRVGETFSIKGFPNDFIEVLKRPSNDGTKSFVLTYNQEETGIIINAVLNQRQRYSQMIIKGKFGILDYSPFSKDNFGNVCLSKNIDSEEVSEVKKELEKLTDIDNYIPF